MEEKFEEIFDLYKDDIYRLAYSYTLNKSDAEDIVQITFARLYKNKKLINKEYLKKWLIKVTVNESKNYLKSNWLKKVFKIEIKDNDFRYEDKNDNLEIYEALKRLSINERIILYLYYFEGYSIKEISRNLNMNENTVKTNMHRAKLKMKIEME